MKRVLAALVVGAVLVGVIEGLGRRGIATPVPFRLLVLGIMAGAYAPDSGFSPEGDQGPWGPLSTFVVYTVNIAIYSVAAYAILWGVGAVRWRTASKTPSS